MTDLLRREDVLAVMEARGLAVMQDRMLTLDQRALVLRRLEPIVEALSALPPAQGKDGEVACDGECLDGGRELPIGRDALGNMVREAWIRWAETRPYPKLSWLVPYDELDEADKEADRQIGEHIARMTLVCDASSRAFMAMTEALVDTDPEITRSALEQAT